MPQLADVSLDATCFELPNNVPQRIATPRAQHSLVLGDPGDPLSQRVPIGPVPVVLGRASSCDVVLTDPAVSRQHCQLKLDGDQVMLTDLDSRNGTFVDENRIRGTVAIGHGVVLQVASHHLTYERLTLREIDQAATLDRDLQSASAYVQSLFPDPIREGPVRIEWLFLPSAQLGGGTFGYRWIDRETFLCYLIDVPGQGASAAMRSLTILNLLRLSGMPDIDMRDPAQVMAGLSAWGLADNWSGFFSVWYGVVNLRARCLRYASAGQVMGFLLASNASSAIALSTGGQAIGLDCVPPPAPAEMHLARGTRLCVMSHGPCEVIRRGGHDPAGFIAECLGRPSSLQEPIVLHRDIAALGGPLDDFVALVMTLE